MITVGEKEIECEASGSVAKNNCYLVNCALPGGLENATRSFIAVENITDVSRRLIKRTVCAMMNLGKTSTIYIGVLKDGTVKGVRLSRQQVCTVFPSIISPDFYLNKENFSPFFFFFIFH